MKFQNALAEQSSLGTRRQLLFGIAATTLLAACSNNDFDEPAATPTPTPTPVPTPIPTPTPTPTGFTGAVYVGTNKLAGNTIAGFGRNADGTLTPIAEYATGGLGGVFAGPGNLTDPLISADSLLAVDNRYVLAVNAGSNTITAFRINADFSLTMVSVAPTLGVGPNSIAYRQGLVYVTNVDVDGAFMGPPDQSGNITGFRLDLATGTLAPISGSTRALGARPSNIEFSPDGRHLVISAVNAGSAMLAGGSTAQITSYGVMADGNLSATRLGMAASTLPGNAAKRNLPTTIGIEVVERGGAQIVIATEAREFQFDGAPGMLPMFQTGSASTWRLNADGSFTALSQDLPNGPLPTGGPTSPCWVVVSPDRNYFWVAGASGAAISSYRLNQDGTIALLNARAASGTAAVPNSPNMNANADGFIEIAISADGRYIYQLAGAQAAINVYQVGADGSSLAMVQRATGLLPRRDTQGLVVVERRAP